MTETFEKVEDIEIRLLLEARYNRYHNDFSSDAKSAIRRRLLSVSMSLWRWGSICSRSNSSSFLIRAIWNCL